MKATIESAISKATNIVGKSVVMGIGLASIILSALYLLPVLIIGGLFLSEAILFVSLIAATFLVTVLACSVMDYIHENG